MIFTSKQMGSSKPGGVVPVKIVRDRVTHRTPHTLSSVTRGTLTKKDKRPHFFARRRARAKTATQLSGMPVRITRARFAAVFALALLYPCALALAGPGSFHRGTIAASDALTLHVSGE